MHNSKIYDERVYALVQLMIDVVRAKARDGMTSSSTPAALAMDLQAWHTHDWNSSVSHYTHI